MTAAAAKKLFISFGFPLIGFGVGWGAFTAVEQNNLLSESTQRWLNINNLKLQLYTQRVLPASVVENYGYPEETLKTMIEFLEKGYTETEVAERMTFDEVLRQCAVAEQMAYLEEHASEAIPYFYIADIFHSWANLNAHTYATPADADLTTSGNKPRDGGSTTGSSGTRALVMRNDPDYESELLCAALYDKMLSNVIPFDVSIRALCVLAVNNTANARRLAKTCDPAEVVKRYAKYAKTQEEEKDTHGNDVVAPEEVTAATLFFLRALNDGAIHTRWLPLIGPPSTGPYPLLRKVDAPLWCDTFSHLCDDQTKRTPETAMVLADVMLERLRCAERGN